MQCKRVFNQVDRNGHFGERSVGITIPMAHRHPGADEVDSSCGYAASSLVVWNHRDPIAGTHRRWWHAGSDREVKLLVVLAVIQRMVGMPSKWATPVFGPGTNRTGPHQASADRI